MSAETSLPDAQRKAKALVQEAFAAMQAGDRGMARQKAMQAARLWPKFEDPWLILASLSKPETSLHYLQRALEINPSSQRALRGLEWARQRVKAEQSQAETGPIGVLGDTAPQKRSAAANLEDTAPRRLPAAQTAPISDTAPVRIKKTSPLKRWWPLAFIPVLALCMAIGIWFVISRQGAALARSAGVARADAAVLLKPSLTASATATPSPTPTPTQTFTPTATATFTASPTVTLTPTATHTPLPSATPTRTKVPTKKATAKTNPTSNVKVPVPNPTAGVSSSRWVDVNLSQQRAYAYENGQVVRSFVVSTGTRAHPTVTGTFKIYVKYQSADMSGPGYYLPKVPYVMYFYQGYGLHGTYWHNNFGTPMSHGCVNFRTDDAAWLYNFASVGTVVKVHY